MARRNKIKCLIFQTKIYWLQIVSSNNSTQVIYMVIDAGEALCVHLHDGYVMSNKTRWGTHYFEWPLQKQKAVAHLSKGTKKMPLNKSCAGSFFFEILLCIISMLQLSVAIRLAFFMQINLTAQQSVSYANSCLSCSPPHSFPSSASFSLAFAEVGTFALFIQSYKVRICHTQDRRIWLLAHYYKC